MGTKSTHLHEIFGKNVKRLRKLHNWPQEYLAELLGVSRSAVANWELAVHEPDFETIARIAKVLEVRPDELFSYGAGADKLLMIEATMDNVLLALNRHLAKSGLEMRYRKER